MTDPTRPIDGRLVPRFSGVPTFLRLPMAADLTDLDVGITGIPVDGGTAFRPGARFGPRAVREMSSLTRPYNSVLRVDPFQRLRIADLGDLRCNPMDDLATLELVSEQVQDIVRAKAIPLAVGGDHSISYGTIQGVSRALGRPLAVVHIDSHVDTWDAYFGNRYTAGTFLRRLIEEGGVDGGHSIQVGIHGPLFGPTDIEGSVELGLQVVTGEEIAHHGVGRYTETIHQRVERNPVYVTLDIDVVDPSFAPGTGTPEAGGLSSLQVIELIQGLSGLEIVGADIVEVSPPYDPAQVTALLAARLLHEVLSVIALSRA